MTDVSFPPNPQDSINLNDLVNEVIGKGVELHKEEVRAKIRHVMNGMLAAGGRIKSAQKQIAKDEDRIKKGKEKIDRINAGDWGVLNSINLNEKSEKEEDKQPSQTQVE